MSKKPDREDVYSSVTVRGCSHTVTMDHAPRPSIDDMPKPKRTYMCTSVLILNLGQAENDNTC